jgi:hypothetical protein
MPITKISLGTEPWKTKKKAEFDFLPFSPAITEDWNAPLVSKCFESTSASASASALGFAVAKVLIISSSETGRQ